MYTIIRLVPQKDCFLIIPRQIDEVIYCTYHYTILHTIFQVPWSQSANILLLALSMCSILGLVQADPDIGKGSYGGEPSHLDVDDPDFSGVVDFSNAIPGTVQVF